MLEYSRAEVVGLHPLFGPETSGSDPRVAVCPGRGRAGLDWITGILLREGYGIKLLEAREHDRLMGFVQAANHLSTLTLALSITRSGLDLQEIADVATETFRERLDRIRSIVSQPSNLFASLLMDNPEAGNPLELYVKSLEELSQIVGRNDKKAFGAVFALLRQVFTQGEVISS
ncbi:MAG: prephenate dehydrogenase/arogenate dehydrogenase family protein [Desulfobacterales bacterium]|nr:prephenate dehydrogenase/arogenate dehydrogenase family protein [Desulfobacterales bacterium]